MKEDGSKSLSLDGSPSSLKAEVMLRSMTDDAIISANLRGEIIFWNRGAQKIFGHEEQEVLGRPITLLIPLRYREAHLAGLARFQATGESRIIGKAVELQGLRKDGSEFPLEVSLATWTTTEGTFFTSVIRDITERKRTEEALRKARDEDRYAQRLLRPLTLTLEKQVQERTAELARTNETLREEIAERQRAEELVRASLKEKEVLLKEIHHRVKNNLQVISSLLNLQSGYIKDPQTLEMFRESQHRVKSMAILHEKLYESDDLDRIPIGQYLRELTAYLFRAYSDSACGVHLHVNVEEVAFGIDIAIPCGLLVTELVSNCLKHAFPANRAGEIVIDLRGLPDGSYRLSVHDDGIGLPEGIDFRHSESLGLQLVSTLAQQLKGTLTMHGHSGTEFEIVFAIA